MKRSSLTNCLVGGLAYSDQCCAKAAAGGIDCDYPEEQLMKILRPGLRTQASPAYQFLKRFNYSTAD